MRLPMPNTNDKAADKFLLFANETTKQTCINKLTSIKVQSIERCMEIVKNYNFMRHRACERMYCQINDPSS